MWRGFSVLALCLVGCTHTFYEPAICIDERMDTVGIWVEGQPYYVQPHCEVWQAMSDSTKCWTNDTERVSC